MITISHTFQYKIFLEISGYLPKKSDNGNVGNKSTEGSTSTCTFLTSPDYEGILLCLVKGFGHRLITKQNK